MAVGAGVVFPAAVAWWLLVELRHWMEQVTAAIQQLSAAVQQLAISQETFVMLLELAKRGGGG